MVKKRILVSSALFHARLCSRISKFANQFRSDIVLEVNGRKVSAKSVMSLLSLQEMGGDEAIISVKGEDEKEAIKTVTDVIEDFLEGKFRG